MNAEAYFELGYDYGRNHDFENGIVNLTEAIRLDPTNATYYYERASQHLQYFQKHNWDAAIADFTEALRLKTDQDDQNFTAAQVYFYRGIAYRHRGNYEAALADFAELIHLRPAEFMNYLERSVIFQLKGDFDSALADIDTVQRLSPTSGIHLTLKAGLYQRQGNKSAATAIYDQIVEATGSAGAYFSRGQYWREQGNLTNAIADLEEAIRLDPEELDYYMPLAKTYHANENFTKAIDIYSALMEHEPSYRHMALLLRGQAFLASGNSEAATNDFEETITVNTEAIPAFRQGYVNRGHAHAALGHTSEAIADYKMALELDPTHYDSDAMHDYVLKNS